MLSSKTIQDTIEVIKCYKQLHRYGLSFTYTGLKKMLTLVFSKEQSVAKEVVECYQFLLFSDYISSGKKVDNLLDDLMKDASLTDLTCIEELMSKLIQNDVFEKEVFNHLWYIYTNYGRNFKALNAEMSLEERRKISKSCKTD